MQTSVASQPARTLTSVRVYICLMGGFLLAHSILRPVVAYSQPFDFPFTARAWLWVYFSEANQPLPDPLLLPPGVRRVTLLILPMLVEAMISLCLIGRLWLDMRCSNVERYLRRMAVGLPVVLAAWLGLLGWALSQIGGYRDWAFVNQILCVMLLYALFLLSSWASGELATWGACLHFKKAPHVHDQ